MNKNKSHLILVVCLLSFSATALACGMNSSFFTLVCYWNMAIEGTQHLFSKLVKPFKGHEEKTSPESENSSPSAEETSEQKG